MTATAQTVTILFTDLVGSTELSQRVDDQAQHIFQAHRRLLSSAVTRSPLPSTPTPQLPELERAFAPGGEGIDVTIASVPGFQGLMELQRSLVRLPQVQSAAVRKYQDDEAAIQLVLSQPMTATAIAEGVTGSTGHRLFVDEARPEALRLRLRFLTDGRS